MSVAQISHEAWQIIIETFGTLSWYWLLQSREQIIRVQGTWTFIEYPSNIRRAVDDCALFGTRIHNHYSTLYIINGLSSKFKDIFASVRTCDTSLSYDGLHEILVQYASYIKWIGQHQEENLFTTHNAT